MEKSAKAEIGAFLNRQGFRVDNIQDRTDSLFVSAINGSCHLIAMAAAPKVGIAASYSNWPRGKTNSCSSTAPPFTGTSRYGLRGRIIIAACSIAMPVATFPLGWSWGSLLPLLVICGTCRGESFPNCRDGKASGLPSGQALAIIRLTRICALNSSSGQHPPKPFWPSSIPALPHSFDSVH